MFGLSEEDWQLVNKLLITPLKNLGCKIYVFGSRARESHQAFSDLDVLVVSTKNSKDLRFRISEIREALENSNLPIKVDVVLDQDLAESYRESVGEDRIEV